MNAANFPEVFGIAYNVRTGRILWVPPLQLMAKYAKHYLRGFDIVTA